MWVWICLRLSRLELANNDKEFALCMLHSVRTITESNGKRKKKGKMGKKRHRRLYFFFVVVFFFSLFFLGFGQW
jgi:hypothetical protein